MKKISLLAILGVAACSGAPGPSDDVQTNSQALDCSGVDTYSAALASYTVDCLGTIGPSSYDVDSDGRLRRAFDRCLQDNGKLQSIDDVLGLQYREQLVPHGKECLAGRWATWKKQFDKSGVVACPRWQKEEVIDAPTKDRIDRLARNLPALSERSFAVHGPASAAAQATAPRGAEENYVFTASYDGNAPAQSCGSPGACAAQCAGGLPGFVLEAEGSRVLADPAYWLLDTVYDVATDPFLSFGYYHPMSYYGPLPGALIGHRNRALLQEACSYYAYDGIHYLIRLKLNCMDINDWTSCVSVCLP